MASFARGSKIEKIIVRNPDDTNDQYLTMQVGPIAFYEDMIDASFHAEIMISDVFGAGLGWTAVTSNHRSYNKPGWQWNGKHIDFKAKFGPHDERTEF